MSETATIPYWLYIVLIFCSSFGMSFYVCTKWRQR